MTYGREFVIGEREVGRLYNVTFYERILRQERHRGESDRGDRVIYFGLRAGEVVGPRVDGMVLHQALAGDTDAVVAIGEAVRAYYDRRRAD